MKTRHFINKLQRQLIEDAIRDAEQKTSGEIVVLIHHKPVQDAVAFARNEFLRRGLQETKERNAVLIFVAPESQSFALIGDEGVHQKCGDTFWSELAATMQGDFRAGNYTAALLDGIERAGALLAEHFPARPDDKNELPNRVIEQ
ncbi:MAG: TPM domain-containing protein [Opitutae bacterium]|nr:TPM domain-containing protein [Opitutae bacterium]